jgi:ribose transport system substrate-binding protein
MKRIRELLVAAAVTAAALSTSAMAQTKVTLGVSIPTATHGFTAGIIWWADVAKTELEKMHPDLKVIVKTSANASEQANQLQDLLTVNRINALVVFPFESAALTQPVTRSTTKAYM